MLLEGGHLSPITVQSILSDTILVEVLGVIGSGLGITQEGARVVAGGMPHLEPPASIWSREKMSAVYWNGSGEA